jgi:16S rRNA G527 N7-methylase RsmG
MLRGLAAPFAEFLDRAGPREVLDIGAGAGGPARLLAVG